MATIQRAGRNRWALYLTEEELEAISILLEFSAEDTLAEEALDAAQDVRQRIREEFDRLERAGELD